MSGAVNTPEPWSAVLTDVPYAEFEGELTWAVDDGEGGSICTLDGPSDEREAIARLIAAAPELLQALRVIAAASEASERLFGGRMSEVTRVFENTTRVARAAIAKAEGQ